uniref:Ty3-gypsy retrotransposon protein n=1 Tax=Angiostrongylus cantonensis TaxID=6313 RepID=A0A0K0D4J8_ANGCA
MFQSVIVDPCCLSVRKGEDARGSQKRKATRPQQVTDMMHIDVTASVVKEKLNASQSKMLEYEEKINHLEAKIVQLQRNASERQQSGNDDANLSEGNIDQPQVVALKKAKPPKRQLLYPSKFYNSNLVSA